MAEDREQTIRQNGILKQYMLAYLEKPCSSQTAIEGLHLVRYDHGTSPAKCFARPMILLVVQGTKHSFMAGHDYVYTEKSKCRGRRRHAYIFIRCGRNA